jgi:hypothetical protein
MQLMLESLFVSMHNLRFPNTFRANDLSPPPSPSSRILVTGSTARTFIWTISQILKILTNWAQDILQVWFPHLKFDSSTESDGELDAKVLVVRKPPMPDMLESQ